MDKSGKKLIAWITVLFFLNSSCGLVFSRYIREKRQRERAGGGSGESFSPNYDLDTVVTVTGKVLKVETFTAKPMQVEAVRFFLETEDNTYEVHLGPSWYIKKQLIAVTPGDSVSVRGSVIRGKIMVQKFEKGGNTFLLRDEKGQPKWFKPNPLPVVGEDHEQ